ncbi:MAG: oxidoreductase [Armatimonadetes bacterium CG_4_10_14_3_um_filter_66_18]|nr:Gfo/Idh/MocA family oxidoreductase [Armatimonadota bacterium]OIO92664.1 MAG: hypothetical protein AUJ96_31865 [Armatimonadetes bacterium CG2_30_66_41]PIU90921.1 MAG: oxidoreductase [Armatimonadetes bacterium CG06_land_8_20_14_3_00_66_21]PIX37390.1 MAG: oxidoreductase [Armatimonadetes bacterium CG_4_8_14_3_um_filter_66_20]PIY50079.1 MAG: oxidoreductase [Armatimonadetes bacterium CG_4_10_14_3_um_filter_66_18]PIZ48575.1 MAG: oxidoreductase [Armatimonadetes bacterium CG_4_10_14_0_8_um_filter_66
MAEREIGFGVLGLGMGQHHARAVTDVEGARLIAVCDHDPTRCDPVAEQYGVKGYHAFADLLADPEVEVVSIATESGTHMDRGLEAVAAGKHLLVEKPVDVRPERVRMLIDGVGAAGVKAAAVFQSRTTPLNKRVKEALDSGRLGRLIGIHALLPWYRAQSYYQGPHGEWKGTWDLDGGGSLANQGVHTVDLVQWFGGRVKSVFGQFGTFAHEIESEDASSAVLRFENGAIATITTTTCAYPGLPQFITIFGDRGTIQKEDETLRTWTMVDETEEDAKVRAYYGPRDGAEGSAIASDPMAVGAAGHHAHIKDLCQAILEDRDPEVTLESALHAVEIFNAIFESGRTGKEVTLA